MLKEANKIRKAAAIYWGCKVSEISLKGCFEMLKEGLDESFFNQEEKNEKLSISEIEKKFNGKHWGIGALSRIYLKGSYKNAKVYINLDEENQPLNLVVDFSKINQSLTWKKSQAELCYGDLNLDIKVY